MKKSILFVDDEPYNAKHPVESLRDAGYDVVFVANAESGLAYFLANAPDLCLVILDYMMPTSAAVPASETLDGLATGNWFLRQARGQLESCALPVLILTNRNVETVRKEIAEFAPPNEGNKIRVRHKSKALRSSLPDIVGLMLK
jgi:CheY-like chemotaxis protein